MHLENQLGDLGSTLCGNVLAAVSKKSCTVLLNQGAAFGSPDMPYTPKEYEIFPEIIFLPGFWMEIGMTAEPSGFGCKASYFADRGPLTVATHVMGVSEFLRCPYITSQQCSRTGPYEEIRLAPGT